MFLAIPGRILAISSAGEDDDPLWRQAEVDFGGVRQTVSLACLSEAQVGDRLVVTPWRPAAHALPFTKSR